MGKLGQAMTDGEGGCGGAVFAVRFIEDMGEVMRDRFLAQPQFLGDLAAG